jgi:hypothetical protein
LAKNTDVTKVDGIHKITDMRKVSNGTYSAKGADMTKGFDNVENFYKAKLGTFAMPESAATANMLEIVAEVANYSKKSLDNRAAFVEKLPFGLATANSQGLKQ